MCVAGSGPVDLFNFIGIVVELIFAAQMQATCPSVRTLVAILQLPVLKVRLFLLCFSVGDGGSSLSAHVCLCCKVPVGFLL
jgi:hypothetical protein